MDAVPLDLLEPFIIRAKQATYAGSGQKLLPYRLGSRDLQYFEGEWAYHDSYLGESDFIGEEAVYDHNQVVWAMNYFGRILAPDQITSAQVGQMIKTSLTHLYAEGRFLGGFEYTEGDLVYSDTNQGDVGYFCGKEWITRGGLRVYELVYHGGLLRR